MTEQERRKYIVEEEPQGLQGILDTRLTMANDEYGCYSTGLFRYHGCEILITIDAGRWHLSIATNHPLGYYEIKKIRYMFLPDGIQVAQIFPPREEFVNVHENCYHLWEIKDNMQKQEDGEGGSRDERE
jgi:hypothetical protein|nr:MAG TPA: hypothetical protein [Caudoviricetes sp.]